MPNRKREVWPYRVEPNDYVNTAAFYVQGKKQPILFPVDIIGFRMSFGRPQFHIVPRDLKYQYHKVLGSRWVDFKLLVFLEDAERFDALEKCIRTYEGGGNAA